MKQTCYAHRHKKDHEAYLRKQSEDTGSAKKRKVITVVPVFKDLPHYTGKTAPKGDEEESHPLVKNKQNPGEIQEAMEKRISSLIEQVSFAADKGSERLAAASIAEIAKGSSKMDRMFVKIAWRNKRRIEEPYCIIYDVESIT